MYADRRSQVWKLEEHSCPSSVVIYALAGFFISLRQGGHVRTVTRAAFLCGLLLTIIGCILLFG